MRFLMRQKDFNELKLLVKFDFELCLENLGATYFISYSERSPKQLNEQQYPSLVLVVLNRLVQGTILFLNLHETKQSLHCTEIRPQTECAVTLLSSSNECRSSKLRDIPGSISLRRLGNSCRTCDLFRYNGIDLENFSSFWLFNQWHISFISCIWLGIVILLFFLLLAILVRSF